MQPSYHSDLMSVQLRLTLADGTHRDMIVGSVYMPYDSEDLQSQEEIKEFGLICKRRLELLLGCDANSHHKVWGSTDINPREESLLDFIVCTKLHILNRGKEPTSLDSRSHKVLDITFCTRSLVGLVRDWRVSSKPSGSGHRQICSTMDQIQIEKKWGHNHRLTNWTGYRAGLNSQLKKALNRLYSK